MPDFSFHEDSGSLPVSQDQRADTSLPRASIQMPEAGPVAQASKLEMLSPRHRLLLSLARPEEQRFFAESVDPGSPEIDPDVQPEELLRASAPAESTTAPDELLRASIPQQEQRPITTASLAKAMEALRRQNQEDDTA